MKRYWVRPDNLITDEQYHRLARQTNMNSWAAVHFANECTPVQQEVPPMDSHSVTCAKCGKTLTVRWSVGNEVSIFGIICPCGHRTATNQSPVKNTDR